MKNLLKQTLIVYILMFFFCLVFQEIGKYIAAAKGYGDQTLFSAICRQAVCFIIVAIIVWRFDGKKYLSRIHVVNVLWSLPLLFHPVMNLVLGDIIEHPLKTHVALLALMALTGFNEEILYRGYVQDYLRNLGLMTSCIVSASIFSIIHLPNGLSNALYALLYGIVSFLYRNRFQNLVPLMIAHALYNYTVNIASLKIPFSADLYYLVSYIPIVLALMWCNKELLEEHQ